MSGDASGGKGVYTQTGGSLKDTAADSPLFYTTNSTGVITLKGVNVTEASGVLLKAAAGNWGTSGANGGNAVVTANAQTLAGSIVADKISTVSLTLKNGSSLTGAVNAANTAESVTGAKISGTTITNIVGTGHTVTYDKSAAADSALGGKAYTLAGGGTLTPR